MRYNIFLGDEDAIILNNLFSQKIELNNQITVIKILIKSRKYPLRWENKILAIFKTFKTHISIKPCSVYEKSNG